MQPFDLEAWDRLAAHDASPALTARLWLTRSELTDGRLALRAKHLAERARSQLASLGADHELAAPILRIADSPPGIPESGATWVLAATADQQHEFIVRQQLSDDVHVGDHFTLAEPLSALIDEPDPWYVLALSDGGARLFRVRAGAPSEVALPLEREDRESANAERVQPTPSGDRHSHRTSAGTVGGPTSAYQQGFGEEDVDAIERDTWYGFVSDALDAVGIDRDPLVLVSLGVHHDGFARRCRVDGRVREAVDHDPQSLSGEELAELARPLVAPLSQPDLEAVANRWHQTPPERRSIDLGAVHDAAKHGRVEWLAWTPQRLRGAEHPKVPHILDDAIRLTRQKGGETIVLPANALPEPGPGASTAQVNALLRW